MQKRAGKNKKIPRFVRAAGMLENYKDRKPVAYAFEVLDAVSRGNFTKWQVVYDISHKRIYFRSLHKHKIKIIELSQFNFKTQKETLILDMNTDGEGDVTAQFKPYTEKFNYSLMKRSLKNLKKTGLMQHVTDKQIEYIKKIVNGCRGN